MRPLEMTREFLQPTMRYVRMYSASRKIPDPFYSLQQNYEKQLAHALYSFVRAGRLHEAIELCQRTHRPWRAASIRGSLLFKWRLLGECWPLRIEDGRGLQCSTAYDRDYPSMAMEDVGWSGNMHRRLWKSTCTKAALNVSTTFYPRHHIENLNFV